MVLWWGLARAAEPSEASALADKVLQQAVVAHASGLGTAEAVYTWSLRLREAQRASGDTGADVAHAQRMGALLAATEKMVAAGTAPSRDLDAARWYLATASAPGAPSTGVSGKPAPAPATSGASMEACFQQCDKDFGACSTEAEHLRLGVGPPPKDAACATAAEQKCGPGGSKTLLECRDREVRACVAARATTECAKAQALCTARCR